MCMSELEEGGHDGGGDDRDGGDGGDCDDNREEKKAKLKFSIQGSHRIPKF